MIKTETIEGYVTVPINVSLEENNDKIDPMIDWCNEFLEYDTDWLWQYADQDASKEFNFNVEFSFTDPKVAAMFALKWS